MASLSDLTGAPLAVEPGASKNLPKPGDPAPPLLMADAITWTLDSRSPWPSSPAAVTIAIEALPLLEDDVARELVEQLAIAIVDRDEELRSVRVVLSTTLSLLHDAHQEQARLKRRVITLLEAQRARAAA